MKHSSAADDNTIGSAPRPLNDDARHQPMGFMAPGAIMSGFHMDLRGVAGSYGPPQEAEAWLDLLIARREHVMPVSVLQLGLGAWQRSIDSDDPDRTGWARVAYLVAEWAALDMDGHGRFIHHQPMPHTYAIPAPWHSGMAQGLGISLLVRHGMVGDAARAAQSLLDPSYGLVSETPDGPVLEEYPADPRPHVLNGWMWGLYGLYDLAHAPDELDEELRAAAADAVEQGFVSLAAQLPEYETGRGWSTYDRYPHPIANVASPFYHRLHVEMLRATQRLVEDVDVRATLETTADRWAVALTRPMVLATAVARKVGFRIVKPRGKAA
ncbi:MAG: D-glucuronyl C5-epimerase family protein [Gaiellales bacterium]